MKKIFLFAVITTLFSFNTRGQNDPTLFTVSGTPVHLSEFNYIYTKTNGAAATFKRESVQEYLDLYTKFKMKVARAKDMKLDTIPALKEELAGYRRQLSDSYLTDKEVTEKLMKEAYQRMQNDISVSHILVKIEGADTLPAYTKAQGILARLNKGEEFRDVAKAVSEDAVSKPKGGDVGYITAMLPDGFYDLETAIFKATMGSHSGIVRSPIGYSILKIYDVRPARGEIEVAHILMRKAKEGVPQPNAKLFIDSIYTLLQKGEAFDAIAQRYSDDQNSAPKGGYLGNFGIGRYELPFEDAAFKLAKDGDYTKPIETSIGWHVIKRISRKGIEPYDVLKARLKTKVQNDSRFELAKLAMVKRIKKESNFKENTAAFEHFVSHLDSTFFTFMWQPSTEHANDELFRIGNRVTTVGDFGKYLAIPAANRRQAAIATTNNNYKKAAQIVYEQYLDEAALGYEESQLESKYSDFKNLMREYEEGILLFEAIKMNVWDKASQDTVGLEKFHNSRKDKFMWDERAQLITYTVSDSAKAQLEEIRKFALKNKPEDVIKKFNKKQDVVSFTDETFEKGKNKAIESLAWKAGTTSENKQGADKNWSFMKVEKILSKTPKTLKEARGYVVADYQEFLEKQWMDELAKTYKVNINKDVLNSIIK
jgi:peptidyl-prolyl cis-trans isomerase SurA